MKVTDWFPGDVKPVRRGVYERDYRNGGIAFAMWNGRRWMYKGDTPTEAFNETMQSRNSNLKWRGLAEKQ